MTIDLKTVKKISKLARISVDDEKAKKLESDLNSIFKFIEKLNQLDTSKTEPLTSVVDANLQLRKDEVKSQNIRDQILKNSPDENKDFFVIKPQLIFSRKKEKKSIYKHTTSKNFIYSSDKNNKWLLKKDLLKMLKSLKI